MFTLTRITQTARLLAGLSVLFSSTAFATTPPAHEDLSFDVSLRGTGSVTIHADEYFIPLVEGGTIVAVDGFTEGGARWQPRSAAIFADGVLGHAVKRVI